jgi:hypothetical protein
MSNQSLAEATHNNNRTVQPWTVPIPKITTAERPLCDLPMVAVDGTNPTATPKGFMKPSNKIRQIVQDAWHTVGTIPRSPAGIETQTERRTGSKESARKPRLADARASTIAEYGGDQQAPTG